jgi:hypothetical protein
LGRRDLVPHAGSKPRYDVTLCVCGLRWVGHKANHQACDAGQQRCTGHGTLPR